MRTKILFIILLFSSTEIFAQYDSEGEEISRFRPGVMWFFTGMRPAAPDKPRKYDRLVFDLVYCDWTGDKEIFNNHWSSIGLNSNVLFDIPLSKQNTVSLGIGLCHQLQRIRHEGKFQLDPTKDATIYATSDSTDQFSKSIFGGNNLSIPVELRFRNASWKHFKLHLGGRVGYQLNLYNKFVFINEYGKTTYRQSGFPDQNDLTYSAHIRIGLRNWALYGSYSFNPLFRSAESVKLNTIQIGLSISLF